ncbi:MAG TPA: ABC transporter ATP-binding protein [Candidatus Lokiarchaeia archaeon]|nr:ABC transporter ATP-binding protein [Candidatus Lokiarchaeia archaeon]
MNATSDSSEEPVIELEGITVVLGKNNVLSDINLKIFKGEYIGLIGKNGSGKSTLIKTILGIIRPTSGYVKVFGKPLNAASYKKIGYTPQMQFIDHEFPATVGEVVAMGLYKNKPLLSRMTNEDLDRVQLALHKVKMEDYINRPIGHLSGGEQQKVLVAQALVMEPEILLMDEPTSALDFLIIDDFLKLLTELNKKYGITLLVIQHNLELLLPYCSRLIMLRRAIMYDGNPTAPGVRDMLMQVFST